MKQIMKKVSSVCTALLCAASLTLAGSVVVFAEADTAEATTEAVTEEVTLESELILNAEGLTEAIIPLTDEEITLYMESGDPFTEAAMGAWMTSREELGAYVALTETEIAVDDEEYTITVNADFETVDAEFVYHFNEKEGFTSLAINPLYSFATNMQRAGLNTLMGMGTVFLVLIFLALLISLFKYVPALLEGKKKEAPAPAPAPVAAAPVVEEVADDTELIAVIAAAIAAAEGAATTDGFVVRSIRKVNRKKW